MFIPVHSDHADAIFKCSLLTSYRIPWKNANDLKNEHELKIDEDLKSGNYEDILKIQNADNLKNRISDVWQNNTCKHINILSIWIQT